MKIFSNSTLLAAAACFAPLTCVQAVWTSQTIEDASGNERRYLKYAPASATGVVALFHGYGGSAQDHPAWEVEKWAEQFGFLALVPDGSSTSGGDGGGPGGGGGGPKLRRTLKGGPGGGGGGGGGFQWNIEDTTGTDDVAFVNEMLAVESGNYPANGPKIAFGFSNGAGMASLMCCYNSTDLFVAHVGCHIDDGAEFSDACSNVVSGKGRRYLEADDKEATADDGSARRLQTTDKTWNAVGYGDFFLPENGVPGLFGQFAARGESCPTSTSCPPGYGTYCNDSSNTNCPYKTCEGIGPKDQATNPGFKCFVHPECDAVGSLCVYENLAHEIEGGMTATMWSYLTGSAVTYDATNGGGSGGGGGGGGGDCSGAGNTGDPCETCADCASGKCKRNGSCF